MSNYELFAKIGGDSSGLRRAMGNAQKSIGITSGSLRKMAAVGVTAFKGLAVAAGGAVGTLTLLTRSGLNFVDSQAKLARSVGGSVDSLRGLQIAASDAGIEAGALGTAMQMMNARLAEAARGGNASAKAIERLGLDANALVNMDVDERIATIADRMQEMGLSAAQAQDELNQLGIRNRQLALLMIQGGDAIRSGRKEVDQYGIAISKIESEQIERANDAFSRLGRLMEAVRIELAVQLSPLIEGAANHLNRMAKEGEGLRTVVRPAVESIIDVIGILGDGLIKVQKAFLEVKLAIQLMMIDFQRFKDVADFLNPLRGTIEVIKGAFGGLADAVGETNEEVQATKNAIDNLAEDGSFSAWIKARQAEARGLVTALSEVPPLLQRMDGGRRTRPSPDAPGVVGPQIFPDFVPDYVREFGKLRDTAEQTAVDITAFMQSAGANIQTALADFLFNPFEDGLKGMLKSFINIINRMVAEIAAAQILTAFFGSFAGQSGIMGQMAAGMGIQPPAPAGRPGMATGGPITGRQPYLVGEKGPEMIVPSKSSYVVPNNKLGGGGGMSLSVNINAEDPGAEGRIRTMIEQEMAPQIIQAATGRTLNRLSRPSFA